jgi:Predicted small integral membrane protein (DUF2165)
VVGGALGFLVWFFGFLLIGGEWFQMWQSSTWNGQQPAFRFVVIILAVLIFVMQPEPAAATHILETSLAMVCERSEEIRKLVRCTFFVLIGAMMKGTTHAPIVGSQWAKAYSVATVR